MKFRHILLTLLASCTIAAWAMTDQQVIAYIKQQVAAGKSNDQIGKELLAKGVTPEQAQRIKAQLEAQETTESSVTNQSVGAARSERRHNTANDLSSDAITDIDRQIDQGNAGHVAARQIYGHKVFNSQALTFEPSENLATPQNYRLGPGDEVVID
ncbi:MAG: capsule biosynthesis protein, partial [Muribaculaceae bacterium]|nr:capsule biosynthesis protein [Muribaculaceae bacterium]